MQNWIGSSSSRTYFWKKFALLGRGHNSNNKKSKMKSHSYLGKCTQNLKKGVSRHHFLVVPLGSPENAAEFSRGVAIVPDCDAMTLVKGKYPVCLPKQGRRHVPNANPQIDSIGDILGTRPKHVGDLLETGLQQPAICGEQFEDIS